MSITLSVFTIGGGDLLQEVLNAVASVFNNKAGISAITTLAVLFGGLFAVFEFSKTRDVSVLMKWVGMYVLVTSLILYPKATIVIEDRTGIDIKPRIVDNVPLALAVFASFTSRIGIGFSEMIETVFHMPDDMSYNKTGMLMGAKLVFASKNFQITDAQFSQTLNEFMQQCVFFDLLLKKYTVQELVHTDNPWMFIKNNTSQARAFPLDGEITVCKEGAVRLDAQWQKAIANAATLYGGQILGNNRQSAQLLLSHLSDGYAFMTQVSVQGSAILQTNLLSNALSQAMSHYGANANAPAALQAYIDTKSELQTRETLDQTGRQAGIWISHLKNIVEAVLYSSFIFVYFLSYFPFGAAIVRNYLFGLFFIQTLAPMYAIINFATNFFAQNRSMAFLQSDSTHSVLSFANVGGITQANADALALAGYLMWPITLGGALMLFRGLPNAIQSMGQLLGGVVQHAGSHVAAEAVGGNISAGNASFGNHSFSNTSGNHWDTNARYAAGGATFQTETGSSLSVTPGGFEVLDNRGGLSNLGSSVHMAESIRTSASHQAQSSLSAALNKTQAAGEQYSTALRTMDDYSNQQGHSINSGQSYSHSETSGESSSSHQVSQLVDSFAKEHHVNHDKAAQVLGQVYADMKVGGGFIAKAEAGISGNVSGSARSAFGSLYSDAHRFATDNNFSETVDSARRETQEAHYREGDDAGSRFSKAISSSFDQGDSFRAEAASQYAKSESYASLASTTMEQAASINANYTQDFYDWVRSQPSPYGQGTISASAIDNMAVHDASLLQSYANRFVDEKTTQAVSEFEQSHHLANGGQSIQEAYHTNNQTVGNKSGISAEHKHHDQAVQNAYSQAQQQGNGINAVDSSIRENVDQRMQTNQQSLGGKQKDLTERAAQIEEKVTQKVEGQVLGSIDLPQVPESIKSIFSTSSKETTHE